MSRPFTLVQVSDTHLSETHAYFIDNFRVFVQEMAELKPDLIVHTGDVSFNGPVRPADLAFASAEFAALEAPMLVLAGNHDVGEAPRHSRLAQPINEERIAAWQAEFGPLFWCHDIPGWRLIGLDTALMASDLAQEQEQWDFLAASLAQKGDRKAMVFMHMPPFKHEADDERPTTSSVPFEARGRLFDILEQGGAGVLACGHLHVYRRMVHRGIEVVWAPTTAMINMRKQFKAWQVWTRPGYLVWSLTMAGATHACIEPRMMIGFDTSRWTEVGGTTTNMPERPLGRFND